MSQENSPEIANKTIDTESAKMLGEAEQEVPIVDALPDPVKSAEKNDGEILSSENLDAEIGAQVSAYVGFDASIHATNKDGTPKFRADGKTYALKRGRKAGDHIAAPLPAAQARTDTAAPSNIDTSKVDAPKVDYTGLGKVYAGMFFGLSSGLIGEEWAPQNPDEKKQIEQAFTMYAKSTGAVDLPPGWALLFALGVYSAQRIPHPNTQSKLSKLKDKIKVVYLWAKTRRR